MTPVRYFTHGMVEKLRAGVPDHLAWYYEPESSGLPVPQGPEAWREAKLEVEPLAPLLQPGLEHDAQNALAVYETLHRLTPQQASDERFWAYVSHVECSDYIRERWLATQPDDPKRATARARNHFFARDARALIRDHGVSRLWWLGRIACEAYPKDPPLFLDVVLHRQDVRSALIERPSVSMNRGVLRGIFDVMRDHWEGDKALFKREIFRAWMVALNRRGGVVLLDALPPEPLDRLLREEADRVLEAA